MDKQLYIGEGFEGPGVNLAHINVLVGPRNGPAGQAFSTALATPSAGHAPFVVIAQPGIPTKPLTLYVNKAQIEGDFHGNATWGASQAGIAKAVAESLENGTLPPEAENDWVVVSANWVNPQTDNLDAVFENNYRVGSAKNLKNRLAWRSSGFSDNLAPRKIIEEIKILGVFADEHTRFFS